MLKTSYDPEADAMFIWFGPEGVKSAETEEVAPGIMPDFGRLQQEGQVARRSLCAELMSSQRCYEWSRSTEARGDGR